MKNISKIIPTSQSSNLVLAISRRSDGNMKIDSKALNPETLANRQKFLGKQKIDIKQVVSARLLNGNRVQVVDDRSMGRFVDTTDGLITQSKNVFLAITVADCLPIVLFDPVTQTLGLLHAGWKGLAGKIIANAIGKMVGELSVDTKSILSWIGPGIGSCHFQVQNDLVDVFSPYKEALSNRDGRKYLDIKLIAQKQLIDLGIKDNNIQINRECTYCLEDKYFSYRRDKPEKLQAMMVVAGMGSSKTEFSSRYFESNTSKY